MTVLWFIVGYSLAFTNGGDLNGVIGSLSRAFGSGLQGSVHELAKTVPENVFLMYQATFAIIMPAIIAGAFAERMKFSAMMWFMALWLLFVYVPVAHWVWGGGFLGAAGVLDFAGGLVVHLNVGMACLVCCLVIGKRQGYGVEYMAPHNLVLTLIGTSLLWVGWFGFNAGSALASGELAGSAMLNTTSRPPSPPWCGCRSNGQAAASLLCWASYRAPWRASAPSRRPRATSSRGPPW